MTRQDIINRVDKEKINVFDQSTKVAYLDTLDGMVAMQLLHKPYTPSSDLTKELLIPAPYNELYVFYLFAMIDQLNLEYDSYNNNMVLFNDEWEKYRKHLSHYLLKDKKSLSTIRDLIDYFDSLVTNSVSDEVKLSYINEVEGLVKLKLENTEYTAATEYTQPLIIPDPFRDIYMHYVGAWIAFLDNNMDLYNQKNMLYELAYDEYAKYLKKITEPVTSKVINANL